MFWIGLTLFSIIVGVSGLVLNFPNFDQGRSIMQNANMIHAVAAVLYIAMMMGHIYSALSVWKEPTAACAMTAWSTNNGPRSIIELWYNEVMAEQRRAGSAPGGGALPAGARAQRL